MFERQKVRNKEERANRWIHIPLIIHSCQMYKKDRVFSFLDLLPSYHVMAKINKMAKVWNRSNQ